MNAYVDALEVARNGPVKPGMRLRARCLQRVDRSERQTRRFVPLRRLGEYELLRKIGAGGMAEVWMGRRAALAGASKAVAVKLLARDVLDDESYRQMFIEEARLSMLLTHSNVVQVFDVGERDGECYMVMEWVDGLNLSELARKMQGQGEKLSTVLAAHVIGEVLRGLAYAHGLHHDGQKATIVHRDVSPQNVLVSVSGEVKLADFGVARLAREETSGLHVKGKLRYMAPEQLRGRSREPTVDLYAVGAILHELLTGTRFRQSRDEGDLYSMVLSGEYPPLGDDVPPVLVRLHAGLLEPDPARRIQSADEALELLYSWAGYRNSSVELARIVRKWIGVAAPRSGILNSDVVAAVRTSPIVRGEGSSAAETLDAPTRQAGGRVSSGPVAADAASTVVTSHESGPLEDRGATETRTFVDTEPETEATSIISDGQRPPRRSGAIVMGSAMALALSFGVFGLGFPLGWWGASAPDAEVAEVAPTKVESAEAGAETGSQVAIAIETDEQTSATKVVEEGGADATDTDEADTGGAESDGAELDGTESDGATETGETETGEDTAETGGSEEEKADLRPATVTFKPGDFTFVWVRVGGKVLALEWAKSTKLKPRRSYKVEISEDEQTWKKAGTIELEPGKRYEVRMTKPHGLTLTKL